MACWLRLRRAPQLVPADLPAPARDRLAARRERHLRHPDGGNVVGEAREDVERYLQCATLGGAERVRLFRLAWDFALSAFAGRQEAYEYFFFGDPVRMAGAYLSSYDRAPYAARIEEFLHRDGPTAASAAVVAERAGVS